MAVRAGAARLLDKTCTAKVMASKQLRQCVLEAVQELADVEPDGWGHVRRAVPGAAFAAAKCSKRKHPP